MAKEEGKNHKAAETKILVCQCQSTAFEVKRQNKTSVSLECAKCGGRISVKGSVATARVGNDEVTYAVTSTLTSPDAGSGSGEESTGDGERKDPNVGPDGTKYTSFRFRVPVEIAAQFRRACEGIRVVNMRDEKYRGQDWQGHAVEYMSADCISGLPDAALAVVDAMEEAVAREQAAAEADGKKWTKRKERDTRAKVREDVAVKLGVAEPLEYKPEPDSIVEEAKEIEGKQASAREEEQAYPRIEDQGRLRKAVLVSVSEYVNETDDCNPGDIRIYESSHDAVSWWDSKGGLLIRILGDERTRTPNSRRPKLYLWMANDDTPEIPLSYAEEMDADLPDAAVSLIEMLPANYNDLPEGDMWATAALAESREIFK